MHDQTVSVHRYLGLHRVPLLLAAVMRPSLTLVPGSRYLLFGGVEEGFEAGEEGLHLLKGPQPGGPLMQFTGQRQDSLHQRLEHPYVVKHVGLPQVEEEAQQGGGHLEPVVHMQHQEPVP